MAITLASGRCDAAAPPERSDSWNSATTVMALSAAGFELLMPRVFFADPEVTAAHTRIVDALTTQLHATLR